MIEKLPTIPSLLHGSLPEKQRQSIFRAFMAGDVRTLVCTDLASRGLDTIQVGPSCSPSSTHSLTHSLWRQVGQVIMYDFPRNAIDFIHRAGRTGRAQGARGVVYCLVANKDEPLARAIKSAVKSGGSLTNHQP